MSLYSAMNTNVYILACCNDGPCNQGKTTNSHKGHHYIFSGNPATAVGIPKVPIVTHFYVELFSKFSISPLYLVWKSVLAVCVKSVCSEAKKIAAFGSRTRLLRHNAEAVSEARAVSVEAVVLGLRHGLTLKWFSEVDQVDSCNLTDFLGAPA